MNPSTYEPLDARIRELEPQYQSDAEARIGRMLDERDMPFFYRQPRLIYEQGVHDIWHPTYTLPAYNSLVIEYADPGTGQDYSARQRVYRANGIAAVLVRAEDLDQPRWEDRLARSVDAEYHRAKAEYLHQQIHGYAPR